MVKEEDIEICSICLENLINKIYITTCNHCFHEKCIKRYVKYNTDIERGIPCPICKRDNLRSVVLLTRKQRVFTCLEQYKALIICLIVQTFIIIIVAICILSMQ